MCHFNHKWNFRYKVTFSTKAGMKYYTEFGLLPFMVEMAHQLPTEQGIPFVPILAKFNTECAINGLIKTVHQNVPFLVRKHTSENLRGSCSRLQP